jgi:hypothetical protein
MDWENPDMTEPEILAILLDDMKSLGLVELKPDQYGKLCWFAVEAKPQAKGHNNMSKKAA